MYLFQYLSLGRHKQPVSVINIATPTHKLTAAPDSCLPYSHHAGSENFAFCVFFPWKKTVRFLQNTERSVCSLRPPQIRNSSNNNNNNDDVTCANFWGESSIIGIYVPDVIFCNTHNFSSSIGFATSEASSMMAAKKFTFRCYKYSGVTSVVARHL